MGSDKNQDDGDPYADDPFFKFIADPEWNACLGSQGHRENYVEGYIEAAIELASAVIIKKMYGKRDTLVLPILYNARHALELSLKYAIDVLVDAGLMNHIGRPNHNIKAAFEALHKSKIGDEQIKNALDSLKPFIDSLSQIDRDGQELRYHINRSGDPSLASFSLVNLALVRRNLTRLAELIGILQNRTEVYVVEMATGTFTPYLSRRDLFAIAQVMPRRDSWNSELFEQKKIELKARYGLSNKQFSKALNVIQSTREGRAVLGVETELSRLSDGDVVWIVEKWRSLHPVRDDSDVDVAVGSFDEKAMDGLLQYVKHKAALVAEIENRLNVDKISELHSMFYLGRDNYFSEYFEKRVESESRAISRQGSTKRVIEHLIVKTNFLTCIKQASQKLGRLSLASQLGD